jgi:hypothetical protein
LTTTINPLYVHLKALSNHNGVRVESVRSHVSHSTLHPAIGVGYISMLLSKFDLTKCLDSYNKYLSVAAAVVRRSLKEEKRLTAERRGQMELRFAKWTVSGIGLGDVGGGRGISG